MPHLADWLINNAKGHQKMRLIDLSSGQPLSIPQRVATFDGMIGELVDATPPKHEGQTGRVFVNIAGLTREMEPTVIAAKWIDGQDVP